MAATPYILPREKRESAVAVGNGTPGPFGPSTYKIFDTADVAVFAKAAGEDVYTDVTAGCTIAKTNPANAYDTFSVTFGANVPNTTSWYHQARRTAERSVAVTKAGTINAGELEKELTKQASAQSELRRDVDRAVRVNAGQDPITIIPAAEGELLSFDAEGNVVGSGENVDSINGSTAAAIAARDAARKWATEAEDVGVDDGVNPPGFSAFNWARKALASAVSAASYAAAAAASAIAAAGITSVVDRAAMQGLDQSIKKGARIYGEVGRNGDFAPVFGDLSALVAADTAQGIYVPFGSDLTGASGAWVRQGGWHVDGKVAGEWFGVLGTYLSDAHDDAGALQAAANMASTLGVRGVKVGSGTYGIGSQIVLPRNISIFGPGYSIGTRWDAAGGAWVHGKGANFAITHQPVTKNEANSTFLMTSGCGVKGVGIWYPNQPLVITGALVQYAPTFGLAPDPITASNVVAHAAIEDIYATNPYHLVSWGNNHGDCTLRNIHGTCLKQGFLIDKAFDVDRITDIHFNPNNAYVAAWPGNGVLKAQFDNSAVFMEIAKADQPYLDRVFSYGCFTGLLLSDKGSGSASGMALGTCGFEGAQKPVYVTGNPQECDFGFTQVGVSKGSIVGYPGQHGIEIAPSGRPKNLNFSRCRSFGSVGSAIQAGNVDGLNLNGFRAANADDKGDFSRGVVSLSGCTEVQSSGMILAIGVQSGSNFLVHIVMNNTTNAKVNDNIFAGNAGTWGSFVNASGIEAKNNKRRAGTTITAAAPFVNGQTNCVLHPLADTPNDDWFKSILAADRAGADVATVQNIFGAAADEFTLDAGTTYEFEAVYFISRSAGANSHTFATLFGGTATLTAIDYIAEIANPAGNVLANAQTLYVAAATASVLTAASTATNEQITVKLHGHIRVNAAGTLIPQFQYSAAPGGAPSIRRGSFFKCRPVGPGAMTTQGPVS
ncbi:hypothetical protein MPL1032_190163 [Mesorhizobium plurifarium]|uniref:Pectate lyase superfamily protein domain-containing protein n=1 Tax=Mesorhizobium plurifarium TaxID=69974 RepID=A0A0K2VUU4_MESPL|nr:hypothetical protein MPL1032_190163 [Mesorhizobium plurifarium]